MNFLKSINQPKSFEARPITALIFNLLFSRRTWSILFVLFTISSMYLNYVQFRQAYNFRCSVNMQVVGYLIKKEKCDELASNQVASQEVARLQTLANNPDLIH